MWLWLSTFALIGVVIVIAPLPRRSSASGEKVFRIEAAQFAYTPGEIHVNTGDLVTLELISTDVAHGLYLDGYEISVTADPGQTRRLTFKADRPGAVHFRCNVTCGAMHPFMIGKLIVGRNDWLLRAIGLVVLSAASISMLPRKAE